MSYSPSLLKGKDEKVSNPDKADRMLIDIAELKQAHNLASDKDVKDFVLAQMKKLSWRGELRTSQSGTYLVAYKSTRFSFDS